MSDDGFFNDLDDVELGIKEGKYRARIKKSEIVAPKQADSPKGKSWVITYQVDEGPMKGEQIQEWFSKFPGDAEKAANAKKWRARRLESLGVPESQWSTYSVGDCIGELVEIGVKQNGGYTNVSSVTLLKEQTGLAAQLAAQQAGTPTATPTPAATDVAGLL